MDRRFWGRRVLAMCAATVMLTGTAVGALSHPSTAQPADTRQDKAHRVVELVNAERKKGGCPALRENARLRAAARKHAKDMADRDYFSHESPEGRTAIDRASAEGYTGGVGENIARGYRTPKEVTKGWMESTDHRQIILDCQYRHTGVGVARVGKGQVHWVQVFGFPQ
jgi:uncharacterized protein YkwD